MHYFFGTKDRLFAAVMDIPVSPTEVVDSCSRMARRPRRAAGAPLPRPVGRPGDRAAAGRPDPRRRLARAVRRADPRLRRQILGRIAGRLGRPDAELRASLCGAQLIGTALERYVLRVEPIASADPAIIAAWLGPTLQRYLTGSSPDRTVG